MRETISVKSFGVALAIILMMVLIGGCERKIIPGNPFDEYDPGEENYSTCYDDEELEIRFTGDYPSVVTMDMVAEDGIPYTIEAIEGQVCVWFEETVSYGDASKAIKKSDGKIVAQIPKNGYYLVEVPTYNVKNFLDAISMQHGVDWAYPNIVFFPSMANNYILDTEYPDVTEADTPPHGIIVKYALWDSDPESPLKSYNIGAENGKGMNLDNWDEGGICPIFGCSHNEYFALKDISRTPDNETIIINMSYGPALKRKNNGKELRVVWDSATYEEKRNYKENYVYYIKSKIKNLSPLQGKDYIAVIAAGNDGIKNFDAEILSFLRNKLSSKEKEIMDKHFLLVTAGETERVNQDYSNEMERGLYDPWVTKTDISDFKFEGKKWKGTSFAAPRAAGILSSVANEMNLTGEKVLKLARKVTKRDGELTKEALLQAIKEIDTASSIELAPGFHPQKIREKSTKLIGTEWYSEIDKMVMKFIDRDTVKVTELLNLRNITYGPEEVRVFTYSFDEYNNKGKMWYMGRDHLPRKEWKKKEKWHGEEYLVFEISNDKLIVNYFPYNFPNYQKAYFSRRR